MAKIIPISEHFQHFLAEMKESFWGELYGQTRQAWQRFFELPSERQRDRFSGWGRYERRREKSFLPVGLRRFQRRAEEVSLLIREAFLRGISTRQVGRVVATITGETVSAQTVSKLTRDLDEAVRQFHSGPAERRLRLSVFGWREPAGAATDGAQAGADAGGLWHSAGRQPAFAGLPAQPG